MIENRGRRPSSLRGRRERRLLAASAMTANRMLVALAAAAGGALAMYLLDRRARGRRYAEEVTSPSIAPTESSANRAAGQASRAQDDADQESYEL